MKIEHSASFIDNCDAEPSERFVARAKVQMAEEASRQLLFIVDDPWVEVSDDQKKLVAKWADKLIEKKILKRLLHHGQE